MARARARVPSKKLTAAVKGQLDLHDFGQIDVKLLPGPDPKEPEDMLVAVNDDRPFLFDSSLRTAAAAGGRIRAAFHPIVSYEGTPTSVIVLMLDVVSDRSGLTTGAAPALTVATCSALKVVSFRNMTEHPQQAKNDVR